jgi:hypothetical protein
MPVLPTNRHLVAVASEPSDVDTEAEEDSDPMTTCGRCRRSFARHPSISPGDAAKWWLCPPCRSRLLGDVSRTNSRWARGA